MITSVAVAHVSLPFTVLKLVIPVALMSLHMRLRMSPYCLRCSEKKIPSNDSAGFYFCVASKKRAAAHFTQRLRNFSRYLVFKKRDIL